MKTYSYSAVENYVSECWNDGADVYRIDGVLLDGHIIFHGGGAVEFFRETAINSWSSGLARHVFKKRVDKWVFEYFADYLADVDDDETRDYIQDVVRMLKDFNEERKTA